MSMLNSTTIASIVFLIIAAGAWQMTGDLNEMGQFFPRVIAAVMGVFTVIQIVVSLMQKKKENPFSGVETKRVLIMIAGISAYVVLLYFVGFILAGVIFLAFFFWHLSKDNAESNSIVKSLVLAVLISGAFYVVFRYGFLVPLPVGVLFEG